MKRRPDKPKCHRLNVPWGSGRPVHLPTICPCQWAHKLCTGVGEQLLGMEARLDPYWAYEMGQLMSMFPEE
jgi:hypothetical protein